MFVRVGTADRHVRILTSSSRTGVLAGLTHRLDSSLKPLRLSVSLPYALFGSLLLDPKPISDMAEAYYEFGPRPIRVFPNLKQLRCQVVCYRFESPRPQATICRC